MRKEKGVEQALHVCPPLPLPQPTPKKKVSRFDEEIRAPLAEYQISPSCPPPHFTSIQSSPVLFFHPFKTAK